MANKKVAVSDRHFLKSNQLVTDCNGLCVIFRRLCPTYCCFQVIPNTDNTVTAKQRNRPVIRQRIFNTCVDTMGAVFTIG